MRKPVLFCFLGWLFAALSISVVARRAEVHFVCLSLRFPLARTTVLGEEFTLELGTAETSEGVNGELMPTFDSALAPSHATGFRLTTPLSPEPLMGNLAVEVPDGGDQNLNYFGDFFESSQGLPTTSTTGVYATAADEGRVAATWSRTAGSTSGVCQLQLISDTFGELPAFSARFDLLEYTGVFEYTPHPATVSGSLRLTQTGVPANQIAGPVEVTKNPKNRFDEFALAAGTWTNAAAQTLSFTNALFLRDTLLRTNYYGYVDFTDGEPAASAEDYRTWQASINDVNDTDSDGLPDLTDDPVDPVVVRPRVKLTLLKDRALIEINGQTGKAYDLEETPSLTVGSWTKAMNVTLTSPTITVELPIGDKAGTFWRVRAL